MAKSSSRSSSRNTNASKQVSKPRPMTPKAGFTANRRRYGGGGKA